MFKIGDTVYLKKSSAINYREGYGNPTNVPGKVTEVRSTADEDEFKYEVEWSFNNLNSYKESDLYQKESKRIKYSLETKNGWVHFDTEEEALIAERNLFELKVKPIKEYKEIEFMGTKLIVDVKTKYIAINFDNTIIAFESKPWYSAAVRKWLCTFPEQIIAFLENAPEDFEYNNTLIEIK